MENLVAGYTVRMKYITEEMNSVALHLRSGTRLPARPNSGPFTPAVLEREVYSVSFFAYVTSRITKLLSLVHFANLSIEGGVHTYPRNRVATCAYKCSVTGYSPVCPCTAAKQGFRVVLTSH